MSHKIQKLLFKPLLYIFLLLCTSNLYAQRYNFQHYDLVNGLAQSQVLSICQDKQKQIWLSTFGGINCFDGNQFNLYSIQDGLSTNANFAITSDAKGNIWWGGNNGLTIFTNKGLVNYGFKDKINIRSILRVVHDKDNGVWGLAGRKLCKLVNKQLVIQTVWSADEFVSDLVLDKDKNVYASVYQSGIYKYDKGSWKLILPEKEKYIKQFIFDHQTPGAIIFTSDYGVFRSDANGIKKIMNPELNMDGLEFFSLVQDHNQNLWIGTNKGVALLNKQSVKFFNESNGFTNSRILSIFCDADNHLWFGTDGAGLYYYVNDDFVIYDKSQGLTNEVVMSLAKDAKGTMYWGTNGGGLWSFSKDKIKQEVVYSSHSSRLRINCLLNDSNDDLWVGTDNYGLWKKNKGNGKPAYSPVSISQMLIFNVLIEDPSHTIWAATNRGCFYTDGKKLKEVPLFRQYCSSLLSRGPDSVLVGSLNGITLIRDKKVDMSFKLKDLAGKNVLTMESYRQFVLIGTNDHGLFVWNTKTNAVNKVTIKDGLHSNTIYSIDIVNGDVWLGTGRGVNKFKITDLDRMVLNKDAIFNLIAETNQNSILHTDSNVWVGTTHGLYVYKINRSEPFSPVPNMVIQNIGLFVKDNHDSINYTYTNGYKLPVSLSLPSDQSHISIKFQAIEFTDEKSIYYQYQLEGLDKTYSKPILNNFVDYPSLPPGRYSFWVRAVNGMGQYKDPAVFSFTITPTFVQSIGFKILLVLLFLSVGYSVYLYKIYQNDRKAKYIEALKLEEQAAVRRQTAEDFHDDLGNKLTRINMLSELLDKKIDKNKNDEKVLIKQIRSSVAELYAGTKNILWALNPDNDNLYDVSALIIKFGCELFSETNISFKVAEENPENRKIRLPLGFGRNIILIGKELLHNILQHSNAKTVTIAIETTSYGYICITISDDGKGFEKDQIFAGNGLRNMQNRAKKLNGQLDIESTVDVGTISRLIMPIP
ncbi:MAG TPA: two-component regulator propeller domain-containing protein [Mucilaginibacter sp.]|nr:two-component regulator propeller domain-containing protein [Mucilaginibacter sp.]